MHLNYVPIAAEILSAFMLLGTCVLVSVDDIIAKVFALVATVFVGIWFFMVFDADYALLVFLIVYLGAVVVFFIFVIILLRQDMEGVAKRYKNFDLVFFISTVLFLCVGLSSVVKNFVSHIPEESVTLRIPLTEFINFWTFTVETNVEKLGELFYTIYAIPLIGIGYLFIVVLIGALTIGKKRKDERVIKNK